MQGPRRVPVLDSFAMFFARKGEVCHKFGSIQDIKDPEDHICTFLEGLLHRREHLRRELCPDAVLGLVLPSAEGRGGGVLCVSRTADEPRVEMGGGRVGWARTTPQRVLKEHRRWMSRLGRGRAIERGSD